jgi:hypothetical protein
MRLLLLAMAAPLAFGQADSRQYTTYTYDLNGRRVPSSTSGAVTTAGGSSRVETTTTINGRTAPVETVEDKVIAEGPDGKVVERTVLRRDPNGRPSVAERVRIEERKDGAGNLTTSTTVYDADINGRFTLRERSTARAMKSGETVRTETQLERPNLNGSLDLVERRDAVETRNDRNSQVDVVVFRRDTNGSFTPAGRQKLETVVSGGLTTVTSVDYNVNSTGQMRLAGQRISRAQKNADGSEVEVVDVYGEAMPGRASSGADAPRLREQQVIERRPGPARSLVETFSVRRADLESGRLGPAQKISESVCTGKCLPDPPKADPPKP